MGQATRAASQPLSNPSRVLGVSLDFFLFFTYNTPYDLFLSDISSTITLRQSYLEFLKRNFSLGCSIAFSAPNKLRIGSGVEHCIV